MQTKLKIGFIGGGNMAGALIAGMVGSFTDANLVHVVDLNVEGLARLEKTFGVSTSPQIDAILAEMDVIVFAVKPQQMHAVVSAFTPFVRHQLLLSVAAGIRAEDMSRWLGGYQKIVRAMPNTPAMVGLGMTGLYAMSEVNDDEKHQAEAIMQAVGETLWVDQETMIDAVTAVSGSGPAYVFYFIEAMQEAAVSLGFSEDQAKQLAMATFHGATQLAKQSDEAVNVLRERVTSKGGTTYAALCSLDESQVKAAMRKAVHAAEKRSQELGDEFGRL